jgi:hypothetical protein
MATTVEESLGRKSATVFKGTVVVVCRERTGDWVCSENIPIPNSTGLGQNSTCRVHRDAPYAAVFGLPLSSGLTHGTVA